MLRLKSFSEYETILLGADMAQRLKPGDVVACYGDLGSGKTSFIRGICQGLGVLEHVASPTFVLLREYHAKELNVYHFDLYRVRSADELLQIGFDEYVLSEGISLIEWADHASELLPLTRYDVHLLFGDGNDVREIEIVRLQGAEA